MLPSTRWIILSFWIGCGSDSVSVVACLNGSGLSLWAAPSRCYIWVSCHPSVDWISAFRRVRFSALSFSCLYTAELFEVINRKGLVAHSYADDTPVHLSVPASESSVAARQFSECIEEIDSWMQSNRLKMNTDKTQLIWIGTRQQLSKVGINEIELRLDTVSFSTSVSDLGVILDNQLKMTDHVAALCRSCFFQLRQIGSIRRSLTSDARKAPVNAFVMSRLDYCNFLCHGINEGHAEQAAAYPECCC